jgi:dihydrodipicolinate synthase/N-acetylneuraminate lyase
METATRLSSRSESSAFATRLLTEQSQATIGGARVLSVDHQGCDLDNLTLTASCRAGMALRCREVRKRSRALFTGVDSQFLGALSNGADGVFSTAGGIVPRSMVEIFDLATGGRTDEARRKQMELQALNRFLDYDPGYVAPAKEALRMMGMEVGDPRSPLPRLTVEERERLRSALDELGVLSKV